MAIQDILANTSLADDMVVEVSDGKGGKHSMTLGEMRTFGAGERAKLAKAQGDVETASVILYQKVQNLIAAGLIDKETLEPVEGRRNEQRIREHVSEVTGVDENDPNFGPLVKAFKGELKKVTDQFDTLKGDFARVAQATTQAISGYLDDTYKTEFSHAVSQLPEELRGEVKLGEVMDFAKKRNIKDERGRFDLSNAIDQMTIGKQKELYQKKNSAEQKKIEEDRKALADMNRPGAARQGSIRTEAKDGFNPVDAKGRTKTIEQALSESMNDDALWDSIAKSASGVIQ